MMGEANPQRAFFYNISLESFVPAEHPLRRIRPLIDDRAIRHACRDLYAPIGRPSIPPEQLLLEQANEGGLANAHRSNDQHHGAESVQARSGSG